MKLIRHRGDYTHMAYKGYFKEGKLKEGYTHYWRAGDGGFNISEYKKALNEIRKIVKANSKILAGGDGEGLPEISKDIVFNGKGEEGSSETFYLPANPSKLGAFNFTKTARRPYDIVVTACLSVLKHFCPSIEVDSDGGSKGMTSGIKLAKKITGLDIKNPVSDNNQDDVF